MSKIADVFQNVVTGARHEIDINREQDILFWTRHWNVSEAELRRAVEYFRPSAGGPPPNDPWTAQYWDMACAHVTFLYALLGIYEVSPVLR